MGKRKLFVLIVVLPLIVAIILTAGIIIKANADNKGIMPASTIISYLYDGQIVFGTADTGASTSARNYKSGAIFLEEDALLTIKGGVISGHNNTYGGAIYVSRGATLTIMGGSIENNTAQFGGAIYVESGGNLILKNGTRIVDNSAEQGPAVYIEEGGNLQTDENIVIERNKIDYKLVVNPEKETLGGTIYDYNHTPYSSNTKLYTVNFGSYPNSFVDEPLSTELENLYGAQGTSDICYTSYVAYRGSSYYDYYTRYWYGFRHTDGNLYVRGYQCGYQYSRGGTYNNGTYVNDSEIAWFKVEPIKWFILNYDEWQSGKENIKLLSQKCVNAISGYSRNGLSASWSSSYATISSWCNDEFFESAFTDYEKQVIALSKVKNNSPTGPIYEDKDGEDVVKTEGILDDLDSNITENYVYIPSVKELYNDMFTYVSTRGYCPERVCENTDFCHANGAIAYAGSGISFLNPISEWSFDDGGINICVMYWLRSKVSNTSSSHAIVMVNGGIDYGGTSDNGCGVRPMIELNV